MNLYPKASNLHNFIEMDWMYENQDVDSKSSDENSTYWDFSGCPVGKPYPWIYEVPKIFTQNITAPITPIPLEEIVFKVISYTITIIAALVSRKSNLHQSL